MTSFAADNLTEQFSGRAPIFPLPNVVMYPHLLLPLHIFEPRYRTMVVDALEGEALIAMALLKPGWERTYSEKTAKIFDTVCLGRITAHERLADGRFNVAVKGLSRAVVTAEEQSDCPYRVGRFELLVDSYPTQPVIDRAHRRKELLSGFRELCPDLDRIFHQLVDADVPLGQLCDVIAHAMRLESTTAQQILEQIDVDQRSDIVLECVRRKVRTSADAVQKHGFPPQFSWN